MFTILFLVSSVASPSVWRVINICLPDFEFELRHLVCIVRVQNKHFIYIDNSFRNVTVKLLVSSVLNCFDHRKGVCFIMLSLI